MMSDYYLGQITVKVRGRKEQLKNLKNHDKFNISLSVLKEISVQIKANSYEYNGTEEFYPKDIHKIVDETKTFEILMVGEGQQRGIGMSKSQEEDLRLDLSKEDWYMHDENYGTDQEKYLIQFIKNVVDQLKAKYDDVYLLRNERMFKIYRFSDGKAIEPDYVLFLREKKDDGILSYQLFIEPKGKHLMAQDRWKEDFLKEIESRYRIETLFENKKYKLAGLPFYNEEITKKDFEEAFQNVLKI